MGILKSNKTFSGQYGNHTQIYSLCSYKTVTYLYR